MTTAAIYARVSSARQREEQTIASQTAALLEHAAGQGLEVPPAWVFEDEGYSGATLVRPALERLRDLAASVGVDLVLCHSPDRLARKYAYQALLIEEFTRAGTEVRFLNGPTSDRPEDALLVQFQGMIAEYERAQIGERTRRGKLHRARAGSINVLGGAPYGYRYVRRSEHAEARYEVTEPEAATEAPKSLASMTVPERLKAAMRGTREQRAQLVRDPNKLVATAVLASPKLTVNEVEGDTFSVLIIPHTLQVTTLGALAAGDQVNLEVDMMARYAARLAETR